MTQTTLRELIDRMPSREAEQDKQARLRRLRMLQERMANRMIECRSIRMIVSPWYADELGMQTRTIRAAE